MKCRCRDCRTVESVIQIVERYEAILGEDTDKKRSNVRALNSITDSDPSNTKTHRYHNNNKSKPNDRPQANGSV